VIQGRDDTRSKRSSPFEKDRKVLEACCRSPVTIQRDLKRARIVLLAAAGRKHAVDSQGKLGSSRGLSAFWRHRYADHGLEGLQDKPRPGKQPNLYEGH